MFKKEIQQVVDGILLDEEEIEAQLSEAEIDDKFVEFYFNIAYDDNIDAKTKFEKIVGKDMRGNIFDNNIGFEAFSQTPGSELYTTDNEGDDC